MHSAAKDVIGLYRRHALAWTRARGTTLIEGAWLERFCSLLPTRPALVDIGCGSGKPIARHLIERGVEVTGVDSSPEMMALFAHNFPSYSVQVVDMRTLSLSRRFDGLLAWNSFFHLSHADQRGGVPRAFRAKRRPDVYERSLAWRAVGSLEGEPLYHASLDGAEYRALLDAHGFDVVAHVTQDPTCGGLTIWLAQLR